jgi:hypothetical protein
MLEARGTLPTIHNQLIPHSPMSFRVNSKLEISEGSQVDDENPDPYPPRLIIRPELFPCRRVQPFMKSIIPLLMLLGVIGVHRLLSRGEPASTTQPSTRQEVAVPARAGTANDEAFARRIVEVFGDCQKIKPGMTRAELVKLEMFDEDRGPLRAADDKSFKQHATFEYRSCSLIKVDVEFGATEAKETRPEDTITKVSMPYIDARPRR